MNSKLQLSALTIALLSLGGTQIAFADVLGNVNGGANVPLFGGITSVEATINDGLAIPEKFTTIGVSDASGLDVNHESNASTTISAPPVISTLVIPTKDITAIPAVNVVTIGYTDTTNRTDVVNSTSQVITSEKFQLTSNQSQVEKQQVENKTTDVTYDTVGDYVGSGNVQVVSSTGFVPVVGGTQLINDETIIVGKETSADRNALTVRETTAAGTDETVVTATGISSGDLTLSGTATVAGALAANGGATVVGGLTADTATVTGALTANGGATVVGGLTADTATVSGALTAGASTLDSLGVTNAATVGGILTANGGAAIVGGLTADTATVTGTLTTTNIINDTFNSNRIQAPTIVLAPRDTVALVDGTVPVSGTFTAGAGTVNRLTGQYVIGADTIYELRVFDSGVEKTEYYTKDLSGNFVLYTSDVSGIQNGSVPPVAGGTTTNIDGTLTTGSVKNVITDQNVTYSETVTNQKATNINGSLNNGEVISASVGTGQIETISQSVVTGIIASTGGVNTYGLEVTGVDSVGTAQTTVTSAGLATTGTVSAATLTDGTASLTGGELSGISKVSGADPASNYIEFGPNSVVIKGGTASTTQTLSNAGVSFVTTDPITSAVTATTTIDANGLLTVNDIVTNSIILNGRDVATDIATNATNIATNTADIATNATNIATAVAGVATNTADIATNATNIATNTAGIATNASAITAEAATRTAADVAIRSELAAGDATNAAAIASEATTRSAADVALNTRVTNETTARTAADVAIRSELVAGDAATLASANTYTASTATAIRSEMSTGNANTLSAANTYTDSRVGNVSRKLDNVEKTAYRGVAIALAAQQAVPNVQPGQVAVFGGVGHYEGETAGSIGVVTSFTNRISASGAFGFAGSNSFGGRVGISYLFGGN